MKHAKRHPLIFGTIILTATGLITRVIGFFYRIYLSRLFGEEGMGIYQLLSPALSLSFSLTAVERAMRIMDSKTRKEIELRDYLIGRLENEIPHCWLNGHCTKRLPNNINFSFLFIEGESMLIMLDMKGICASSGSACTSGSLDPSHVLLAIGLKHEEAHGSLRLTLSEDSTKEEMDIVAEEVKKIVQRLRDMSPLYEDFLKSQKNN